MNVLMMLREKGNTVIVIEHNLDVIKMADWVVDLGPDGGSAGGNIVDEGTPEDIAARFGTTKQPHGILPAERVRNAS